MRLRSSIVSPSSYLNRPQKSASDVSLAGGFVISIGQGSGAVGQNEYDELEIYLTKPHVVHEYDNLEKSNTFQITQVPE